MYKLKEEKWTITILARLLQNDLDKFRLVETSPNGEYGFKSDEVT